MPSSPQRAAARRETRDDPFAAWDAFDLSAFRPPWWKRLWINLGFAVRAWWCSRVGHDYEGGSGFNGEYVQHWYQCRRCGDGGSD